MGIAENETHIGTLSISVNKSAPNSYIVIRIRCFFDAIRYIEAPCKNSQTVLYKKVCGEMKNKKSV